MRQREHKSNLGLATLIFSICAVLLLFSMSVVRTKCISVGYELSDMASRIETKRIDIEKIEADRSAMVSKEKLYPIAAEKGFILRQEGKTFNVQ